MSTTAIDHASPNERPAPSNATLARAHPTFQTAHLPDTLQRTLGDTMRVERELGGGGRSRVFVATELSLGRQVVIKVLAPELAAGVSAERFRREIQLVAKLQHPHIVPILSAVLRDALPAGRLTASAHRA